MVCPEVKLHEKVLDVLLLTTQGVQSKLSMSDKEVIVGSQCGIAVLRGANVFAPGVMAARSGQPKLR